MIWDFKACSICKINGTTVQAQWTVVPLTFLHFSSFRVWSYSCYPAHLKKMHLLINISGGRNKSYPDPDTAPGMRPMNQNSFWLPGLQADARLCQTITAAVKPIPAPARGSHLGGTGTAPTRPSGTSLGMGTGQSQAGPVARQGGLWRAAASLGQGQAAPGAEGSCYS